MRMPAADKSQNAGRRSKELKERKHYEKIEKNRSSKSGRYDAVDRMRNIL